MDDAALPADAAQRRALCTRRKRRQGELLARIAAMDAVRVANSGELPAA